MKNSTEVILRIQKLEVLKKSAVNNSKRANKNLQNGGHNMWAKLAESYQTEINNIKNETNGNN
jgi:hypothetical protein